MATLGRRARERRQKYILGGIALLLVTLALGGGAAYLTLDRPERLDAETLCPADGPKGHHVLLIDMTDPLNFTQKQALSVTVKEIIERRVPEGFLFSVFALGDDFKENALPLVEMCNPGDGSNKSELTANLRKLKQQYESKFSAPMVSVAESLVATKPANWSPIFEMLQLVGINAYRKHAIAGEKRLIIVSDMLQNTPQFTMYRGAVDYGAFSTTEYGARVKAELSDVDVELHYLMNRPQLQTKRNLKFWEDHFSRSGARIVAVQPIEG